MHLKSIPILPEQLGVPGGDKRLNLRGPADREGPGGGGDGGRGGAGAGRRRGADRGQGVRREKWSGFAWLLQRGKSRPFSDGFRLKNGRETPGCSRVVNPNHSERPNPVVLVAKCLAVAAWKIPTTFKRYSAEKTVAKRQAPAAWQISTVLGGPTGGNPTEERGRRRRPLQVR